jgi:hypothetical protein
MVKLKELIETSDEIMEQIVLTDHPNADIYKDMPDGQLRIKKRYGDLRVQIFTIMNNNFNGGKAYDLPTEIKEKDLVAV